jgi:hypothetical protein
LTSLSKNSLTPWLRVLSSTPGLDNDRLRENALIWYSAGKPSSCPESYAAGDRQEKVRPLCFLPGYSRHRDYLGLRLVSACPAVGKPQSSDRRCPGQPSPVHGHGLLQRTDDVANLAVDPANANVFFGDKTASETYILKVDFSAEELTPSSSTIPGTPPVYFSPDSRLVYAVNQSDIGIYALKPATGALTASTALPDSGQVSIATVSFEK